MDLSRLGTLPFSAMNIYAIDVLTLKITKSLFIALK
jgi:hypothetical protein